MITTSDIYDAIPTCGIHLTDLAKKLGVYNVVILRAIKELEKSEKVYFANQFVTREDYRKQFLEIFMKYCPWGGPQG